MSTIKVFAALGDETRYRLFRRLVIDGPQSTVRLTEDSGISRQAVTKHLRILESVGLIMAERRGRENRWLVQRESLDAALRELRAFSDYDTEVRSSLS